MKNQSSKLVNKLARKSSSLSATVSQSVSQLVSKLVSREVSKSVSKSATSQSVSQRISWSCVKVNHNTMTESFLCNYGIWQEYETHNLQAVSFIFIDSTQNNGCGPRRSLSGKRGNWE